MHSTQTSAGVPQQETLPETCIYIEKAFCLLIIIATIVNAEMYFSLPLFFGAHAPLAAVGAVGQLADDPRSGIGVSHAQHELSIPSDNLSSKRATFKLNRGTAAVVFLLGVAAGVAFLVLQCFRALTSGRIKESQGATARSVAE